ncbi:MAG: hypothetical protein HY292_24945 [Planctomycetes bacterium]|nr:hypothetical protein [Planctomycetota bacterium]
MKPMMKGTAMAVAIGLATARAASAAEIHVNADITTDTTWTSNNTYNLDNQIYVTDGAALTIEAGTVIATTPTPNGAGSIAVTRGSKIFALGTVDKPVIFTSTADVATWVNGDPRTGTLRHTCSEWGNLTVMGRAYISENAVPANTHDCNANNFATMEGLTDPNTLKTSYGGGDDNDDSGTIKYVSLRYTGRVVGLGNELNGLSMGGVGRGTTVHHVDIMCPVDDGIETWGGTVNYKYVSIWNAGDDSFDFDQGWRGKAQFGLIVQGYSCDAARGSGGSDNCFEMDGAECADYQPVSTNSIWNFTAIGNPLSARRGSAWRDGDRTQFHNCIWMDLGLELVHNDNADGDNGCGSVGYGLNGTLPFFDPNGPDIWDTDYSVTSSVNACMAPASTYQAQSSGKLASITSSVFFNNLNASAYTEATQVGVFDVANNNILAAVSPIKSITRAGDPGLSSGYHVLPVTSLDPRAANDALTIGDTPPNDGFFTTSATFHGAFDSRTNWLCPWTAAYAYGISRPTDCCRQGNLNGGRGAVTDVLTINGTVGDDDRTVTLSQNSAFNLSIVKPPAGGSGRYALYVWIGAPNGSTDTVNPQGLGTSCFPTPLTSHNNPQPRSQKANNIGRTNLLGVENWPGPPTQPAPYTLLNLPTGLHRTGTFFFQGIQLDAGAPNGQAGVTNGIVVVSQ